MMPAQTPRRLNTLARDRLKHYAMAFPICAAINGHDCCHARRDERRHDRVDPGEPQERFDRSLNRGTSMGAANKLYGICT
jgi:hypothetical protein